MATTLMACHTGKLMLHGSTTRSENAQNLRFLLLLLATALLVRAVPAAYRRASPALRLALLLLGYTHAVFSSLRAMDPPMAGPTSVPLVGPLLDVAFLWMSTKCVSLGSWCA